VSDYLVYGDTTCATCGRVHGQEYHIRETQRSRVRALRLCAEVASFGQGNKWVMSWTEGRSAKERETLLRSMRDGRISPAALGYPAPLVREHGGDPAMFAAQKMPRGPDAPQQAATEAELRDRAVTFFAGYMHVASEPTIEGMAELFRMNKTETSRMARIATRMVMEGWLTQIGNQFHCTPPGNLAPRMPQFEGSPNTSFMIGVLISGHITFAAASGSGNNSGPFKEVIRKRGYRACKSRSADGSGQNRNLAGNTISRDVYAATQADSASPPGSCAAPRLIQEALDYLPTRNNWANWEMSEVWYFPANDPQAKGASDLYTHSVSAYHCRTCQNLVPILMHNDTKELFEGVGKASTMSQEDMRLSRPRPPSRRRH